MIQTKELSALELIALGVAFAQAVGHCGTCGKAGNAMNDFNTCTLCGALCCDPCMRVGNFACACGSEE
jgi:hypothetical protein